MTFHLRSGTLQIAIIFIGRIHPTLLLVKTVVLHEALLIFTSIYTFLENTPVFSSRPGIPSESSSTQLLSEKFPPPIAGNKDPDLYIRRPVNLRSPDEPIYSAKVSVNFHVLGVMLPVKVFLG